MDEWGWNPASFEAIGTVAATLIAVLALLIALGHERSRREQDRREARWGRAQLVSVRSETPSLEQLREDKENGVRTIRIHLHNAGPQPVHNPSLVLRARTLRTKKWWETPVPPWQANERFHRIGASANRGDGPWPWLGFEQYWIQLRDWPQEVPPATSTVLEAVGLEPLNLAIGGRHIGISFRDAHGYSWTRCADGTLLAGRGLGPWRHRNN